MRRTPRRESCAFLVYSKRNLSYKSKFFWHRSIHINFHLTRANQSISELWCKVEYTFLANERPHRTFSITVSVMSRIMRKIGLQFLAGEVSKQ